MLTLQKLTINGEDVGVVIPHNKPDGTPCGVTAYWKWAKDCQIWKVTNENPLSLNPSIVCTLCGLHGFITNGKFV